jgi:uncharacterized protein (TIGR02271 family)
MFDNRSEAEAARERLTQSSISADNVRIVEKGENGDGEGSSAESGAGFWTAVKDAFMPDEDRHAYAEGVRRGGYLLCARVEESQANEACQILEQSNSVDFDQRQSEWRNEGWQGYQAQPQAGFGQSQNATSASVEEERIPIVEEQLQVGKRDVERGGARVRSYVQETPVSEQVTLRDEHVSVERRPVDQPISSADTERGDLFQSREVEMTEHSEEAVVAKEARVREEMVVRKTAEERTENIQETVRHTEVEVDEGGTGTRSEEGRGAFGFSDGTGNSATGNSATGNNDGDMRSAEERTRDGAMQGGR